MIGEDICLFSSVTDPGFGGGVDHDVGFSFRFLEGVAYGGC